MTEGTLSLQFYPISIQFLVSAHAQIFLEVSIQMIHIVSNFLLCKKLCIGVPIISGLIAKNYSGGRISKACSFDDGQQRAEKTKRKYEEKP